MKKKRKRKPPKPRFEYFNFTKHVGLEDKQARDVLAKLEGLSFFEGVTTAIEIMTGMNEQLLGECPICMEDFGESGG